MVQYEPLLVYWLVVICCRDSGQHIALDPCTFHHQFRHFAISLKIKIWNLSFISIQHFVGTPLAENQFWLIFGLSAPALHEFGKFLSFVLADPLRAINSDRKCWWTVTCRSSFQWGSKLGKVDKFILMSQRLGWVHFGADFIPGSLGIHLLS